MSGTLKGNVDSFNRDVRENTGYLYTTNARYSCRVANERLTRATLDALPPGTKTVLDVGCGDGVYTSFLKKALPALELTGLDPAGAAIERAKKEYPGVTFLVGNALERNALPQGPYDVGVLRGILHHTADPALAIKNLAALCKTLIIIEPNGYNIILKAIEKFSAYHREHEEQSFTPRTIRRWCQDAGCTVVAFEYAGFVPFFCPTLPAKIIHALQPVLEEIPVLRNLFSAVTVIQCKSHHG